MSRWVGLEFDAQQLRVLIGKVRRDGVSVERLLSIDGATLGDLTAATENLTLIEAPSPRAEAEVIACSDAICVKFSPSTARSRWKPDSSADVSVQVNATALSLTVAATSPEGTAGTEATACCEGGILNAATVAAVVSMARALSA